MSRALKATFEFLAKTENEAAVDVLVAGLDCPRQAVRHYALRGLLERRSSAGHRRIFQRLSKLDEGSREIINERPDRLVGTVKEALRDASPQACRTACEAIGAYRLYPAITALVSALTDSDYPHTELVAETILGLTESFYAELSGSEDGEKVSRKGQEALRSRITTTLEDAVRKFHRHQQTEVVEALLMVAKPRNVALRTMLQRTEEGSHQPIIDALANSTQGGVIRLLLGFLEEPQMPRAVRKVLCERNDAKFVDYLLRTIGPKPSKMEAETLAQLKSIAWAQPEHPVFGRISDEAHEGAVQLLMGSGLEREKTLEMIGYLLLNGKPMGRRAAAKALAEFKEPEATALVVRGLGDDDPLVRANLVVQIRPRKIPGALSLLIGMVDDPSPALQDALCSAMPEFSLRQFLTNFDVMDEDLKNTAGHIVQRIDPEMERNLISEMNGPSPVRRRRAVQAALAMGVIPQVEKKVIELVADSDHMVRVAAAEALAECKSMPSWDALRDAMFDRSVVVQEAAESSLQRISQSLTQNLHEQDEEEDTQEAPEKTEEVAR